MMRALETSEVALVSGGACEAEWAEYNYWAGVFSGMSPSDPGYYETGNNVQAALEAYQYCMATCGQLVEYPPGSGNWYYSCW